MGIQDLEGKIIKREVFVSCVYISNMCTVVAGEAFEEYITSVSMSVFYT